MSEYIWQVTYDHLEGEVVNVVGPHDADKNDLTLCTIPFRMYDDDGVLYYAGAMSPDCEGFEPLDDYGMPNAGCTMIRLLEDDKWVTL